MEKQATIFTAQHCAGCHNVKTFLEMVKIPYVERPIEEFDNKQRLIDLNIRTVPVVIYNGEIYIGDNDNTYMGIMEQLRA